MASLEEVDNYITELNRLADKINSLDSYEQGTQPLVLQMVQAGTTDTSFGRASAYIVSINDTLSNVYLADQLDDDHDVIDQYVKRQFREYNAKLDMLYGYFNQHWWQYGGDGKRPAIATLPPKVYLGLKTGTQG